MDENIVRVNYRITRENLQRITAECERRRAIEGGYVSASRIINELIAAWQPEAQPSSSDPQPQAKPLTQSAG